MPVTLTIPRRFLQLMLFFVFLCLTKFAAGQDYKRLSHTIDSLAALSLPKSALAETDKLDKLAREQKNTAQHIKAILYRMRFQSLMEDNAIVAVINSLKLDIAQAAYPEKPVLQSLLGTMYWNYYRRNSYTVLQRSHIEKPGTDFTLWDMVTLVNEIDKQFRFSLQDADKEQNTAISVLDGVLEGDNNTRILRPTLYDMLVQNALDFYLADDTRLNKPKAPFGLYDVRLFGDSRAFAVLNIKTTDTVSTLYRGIKYMQQATLFHLQKQYDQALADLDLKRLDFMYTHASVKNKDQLYFEALTQIAGIYADKPVSADAIALQGKYYFGKDSLKTAVRYFNKAAAAFPGSFGSQNAVGYLKAIQLKELKVTVEHVNSPGQPLLGLINYRNIKTARLQLYKISATAFNRLAAMHGKNMNYNNGSLIFPSDSVLSYLKKQQALKEETMNLPDPQDYKNHSAEFKIDPLPTGIYVLILQDPASAGTSILQLTTFKVTHLAFATRREPDGKIVIQVTDRETGKPMAGVHVIMAEHDENKQTDKNGACNLGVAVNNFSVKLTTNTDTLYAGNNYSNGAVIRTKENITQRTILFTDREIYRPGQTIYFKGLHLQTENGKSTILPHENLTVSFTNSNRKVVSTLPVVTNEFGTFSGSFIIPQSILNGGFMLATNKGAKYISVEEYKRPGFQVEFEPVTGTYKPNDSVKVKGNVAAYSGYGISQARVVYHISRQMIINDYRLYAKYMVQMLGVNNIITDTVITDNKGQFEIKFKAIPGQTVGLKDFRYNFYITADVTDGNGETRSANTQAAVSTSPLTIIHNIPGKALAHDTAKIQVQLNNLNGIMQSGDVHLNIYALKEPGVMFKSKLWAKADQYLMDSVSYKKDFPAYIYNNENAISLWPVKNKVAGLTAASNGALPAIFNLDELKKQPSGTYKIIIDGKTAQGDTTSTVTYMKWVNEPAIPHDMSDWVTPLVAKPAPGQPLAYYVGNGVKGHVLVEKYSGPVLLSSQWVDVPEGKQKLIEIPVAANEKKVDVQFLMISQNRLYISYQQPVLMQMPDDKLDIKLVTFRNKLQPGEKEQWKLQISNKNKEAQAAEMVADLYDASLDAISNRYSWNNSMSLYPYNESYFAWSNYGFVNQQTSYPYSYSNGYYFGGLTKQYEKLNMFGYNYYGGYNAGYRGTLIRIRGGATYKADTVLYNAMAYDEIRIDEPVGNSDQRQATAATLNGKDYVELHELTTAPGQKFSKEAILHSTREISALGNFNQARNLPADMVEGLQVVNAYGDQAATAGRRIDPRKNFNETAFFYPQLHTDEKGQILIDFTIPEALTQWRFKAFAHTKDLQTGYIEQEIVTQKQLSVTTNMPRFLRAGDTVTVAARLANLTSSAIKGKVQLQLFNALNMQPVGLLIKPADAVQSFDLAAASNKPVSFRMVIPAGLEALTYRITADGGAVTDGEENTLPVLTNQMLVTESMPMMVRPGQTRAFTFDKLIDQHSATLKSKTLTLEYTQNPAWYAVQALPYMMEFPYECSEQVFNRYYANSLATNLVNHTPAIQQVFAKWKAGNSQELISNLEKNQELKAALIEETPWLQDAQKESEQKKRIALLFDLNKMSDELQQNLEKLQKKQLPDGGFSWFGGDRSDGYITRYILAGIGQLYHLKITDTQNALLKDIADKAMHYTDVQLLDNADRLKQHPAYENHTITALEIYTYYARSYFPGAVLSDELKALQADYLKHAAVEWKFKSIYEQGLIALTMLRNQKADVAQMIIKSLNETARHTDDMGMYWAKNQTGYYWYQAPVETQSLMIELFTEAGSNDKAVEELKIWLLRNKQTTNWKTTKATAAACYALLLKGDNWLADNSASTIKLGGVLLADMKPDLKADAGTGYLKTTWADGQVKPALGKAEITNNGNTVSWGALHWQYLENLDKITPSQTDLYLERKYFIQKQTDNGPVLIAVDATHQPHTGDLLKVVVNLKAGRDFEYVQLKDMRPAGTEPVDVLSTYKFQDGLYYYQVTNDRATNFFISNLNKGSYVFEYSLRVVQPGSFSTGISTIQSMYAPGFNAHSAGQRLVIKP